MASTVDHVVEHLARAVQLLEGFAGDARDLLAALGWELPPGVDQLGLAGVDVSTLAVRVRALNELRDSESAGDLEIAAAVAEVAVSLADTLDQLRGVATGFQATPEYLATTRIVEEFFPRLADLLVIQMLGAAAPAAVLVAKLLGVVELTPLPADPAIFQVAHVRQVVRWDRLPVLLTDPGRLPREVYGWGTASFDGARLIANLAEVLDYLAVDVRLRRLPRRVEEQVSDRPVPEADDDPAVQLLASLDRGLGPDPLDVGISVYPLRPETPGGTDGGLGISPYLFGTAERRFPLSERLSFVIEGSAAIESGLAVLLRAGRSPDLRTGLLRPGGDDHEELTLSLRTEAGTDARHVLLALPGARLEAAAVSLGVGLDAGDGLAPRLSARIEQGQLVLEPQGADGFLAAVLPEGGVTADFALGIGWSARDGVRFEGGVGLRTSIPLHSIIGPFRLETLDVSLLPGDDAIALRVTIVGAVAIGPVVAAVAGIGTAVELGLRPGNAGPFDVGSSLVPPSGLGLTIDAGPVTGGGFLFFDAERAQYSGAVSLEFAGLTLKAFGLLTTRLSGGGPGYSLLVVISAEFTPIALGMGFTLNGVGGLVAINRTVAVEALRAGLKAGSLGAVFADPVTHATELVGTLGTLFPTAPGRHLFGPIARIGWGTPTVITIDLCLVWELPAPERLVVLGQLRAVLPDDRNPVVRLKMELIGVIDFDRRQAAVDATLVDSRVASFAVTGDMAMRLAWGLQPSFLLAVGGFHPRFLPPPGFPRLQRVTVALATGDNPRLRLEAYLALTANTVQLGARIDLLVKKGPFTLAGFLSFDALVVLRPLGFEVDIAAHLAVKAGGRTVVSVSLAMTLSGPQPWRARGKASFSLLFIDVTFRFDVTIGAAPPPPPAEGVDVGGFVLAALADARSWTAQLPPGGQSLVSLRQVDGRGEILAHPLGNLEVRQRVAPLERTLERFGAQVPVGANRLAITRATVGGGSVPLDHLDDLFAPGQFEELTDDQRLSRPSFEAMRSGVRTGEVDVAHGPPVTVDVLFEQRIVTSPGAPPAGPSIRGLPTDVLVVLASSLSAGARTAPSEAGPAFRVRRVAPSSPVP